MTHQRRILEGIDACRPGSDDLRDPDLAFLADELARSPQARELYNLAQHVDGTIAAAMADVPVPEGGASRLLARLAAAEAESAPAAEQPAATVAASAEPAAPASRKVSRRWFVAAAISGAIAATLAVAIFNLPSGPEVNKDNLADFVREFFKVDQALAEGFAQGQPPVDYSLSPLISVRGNVRWRQITGLLGSSGVAYDLPPRAGRQSRAVLYVLPLPSSLTGLGSSPPRVPSTTAGVAIGAWQEKGRLYVLAVSGGADEYRLFLRTESIA